MRPRAPTALKILRSITRVIYLLQHTGLPRIAEWIRSQVASKYISREQSAMFWIGDFMGRLEFCCDLRDHMGSQIFFRGAYSLDQLKLIELLFSEPYVFIDIGANQGEFTVFVAALGKDNQVLAFEPTSQMLERLNANIAANNLQNVSVFPVGLADAAQENVPIFGRTTSYDDGTYNSGLPTIFAIPKRDQLLETITLQTLDETLASFPSSRTVDLIKIDVEGAELKVMEGGRQTIANYRPLIIFEASDESSAAAGYCTNDLFQFIESFDYELRNIGNGGMLSDLDRNRVFCNVLAIPRERIEAVQTKLT